MQRNEGGEQRNLRYVLDIRDVSKSFQRRSRRHYSTLKSYLLGRWRSPLQDDRARIEAIKNLTIRVPEGSSVGVIGKNGSGKSTLLKLITGIYKPESGSVRVDGRIAALIELGAGFHPDFSGRENLYLGGAIHGLSQREVSRRMDDIVSFAELEEAIDAPVRTYSSGMFMRLGFSLAVHTDPDILLVDEVLAVGDAAFVAKCKDRIAELRNAGKTLLLVSHDLSAVERWCDEVLWLDQGQVQDRGNPRRVIDEYRQFVAREEENELRRQQTVELVTQKEGEKQESGAVEALSGDVLQSSRWGSREVEIDAVSLFNIEGESRLTFGPEDGLTIEFRYTNHDAVKDLVFGVGITRSDGLVVIGSNTDIEEIRFAELPAHGLVRYRIERLGLTDGQYRLDVAVHASDGYPYDYHQGALVFAVRSNLGMIGTYVPPHTWEVL